MEKKKVQKLMCDLYEKIDEVNIDEIASRIEQEALWNWCGSWMQEARAILNDLEREVLK